MTDYDGFDLDKLIIYNVECMRYIQLIFLVIIHYLPTQQPKSHTQDHTQLNQNIRWCNDQAKDDLIRCITGLKDDI